LADARSENECQRDEVFRRFSVKVPNHVAFKVGANQAFHGWQRGFRCDLKDPGY
jgi:hypothetical protein